MAGDQDSNFAFAAGKAMLLLQIAASHAAIGPFAKLARETPAAAARRYGAAMSASRSSRLPRAVA